MSGSSLIPTHRQGDHLLAGQYARQQSDDTSLGNFITRPSFRYIQKNVVRERTEKFESGGVTISSMQQPIRASTPFGTVASRQSPLAFANGSAMTNVSAEASVQAPETVKPAPKSPLKSSLPGEIASDLVSKRLSMFEGMNSIPSKLAAPKPVVSPKPRNLADSNKNPVLTRCLSSEPSLATRRGQSAAELPVWPSPKLSTSELRPDVSDSLHSTDHCSSPSGAKVASALVEQIAANEIFDAKKTSSVVAPPKPPRAIPSQVSQQPSHNQEQYGLLVFAVSPTESSKEVQVRMIKSGSVSNLSLSPGTGSVKDTIGRLESKFDAGSTASLPRSQSRVHGSPSVRRPDKVDRTCTVSESSAAAQPIYSEALPAVNAVGHFSADGWDKRFIRSPFAVNATHARGGKDNFLKKNHKVLNNPNYMFVSDDIMKSHATTASPVQNHRMTRYRSDEQLNTSTHNDSTEQCYEPIYAEAFASPLKQPNVKSTVQFDASGYATPYEVVDLVDRSQPPELPVKQKHLVSRAAVTRQDRQRVYDKVSSAYSILHLTHAQNKDGTESIATSIDDKDSEVDLDMEEHSRRLRHVTRVKEATYMSIKNYERVKLSQNMRLFEYALIIGLQSDGVDVDTGSDRFKPVVLFNFPKEISATDQLTCHFCFPEADEWQPVVSYDGETYSFLLTSAEGGRKYGWCCRYLPAGEGPRLPEAICIVSKLGEPQFYNDLLSKVFQCRVLSMDCAQEMLQVAYARSFPEPNCEVYIKIVGPNYERITHIVKREVKTYFSNLSFDLLLSSLSVDLLVQVFAAILLERKLIFCSSRLHVLSSCMSTLVTLLYPFEWQHTFITVLPSMLLEIVDAPTPYIVGILTSMMPSLDEHELHEVLVVDLDNGCLQLRVGDEGHIIPKKIQKAITLVLNDCSATPRSVRDAAVAEVFLRMFVETCGHYDEFINRQQDGENIFQRELFVKAVSSRSISMFLEWFTQTQMFEAYIMDRLKSDATPGYFEQRVAEYREEMDKVHPIRDMKVFRKFIHFMRETGEKMKKSLNKNVFV